MIMIPKTKDDLTIEEQLEGMKVVQVSMHHNLERKLEELEEGLVEIKNAIKGVEVWINTISQFFLEDLRGKIEEKAKK